ncbi:MAG: 6-phosphogluconolactonase [Chlamydiae bacterium]|nr:6-phosphogluconolactonase [Chlamydiota bacterium]
MPLNIFSFDERRQVAIAGSKAETIDFATKHLIETGIEAIKKHGIFTIALSGGSTPKAVFQELKKHKNALDWSLAHIFWSDERAVGPDHPDSNYKMAMDNGIADLPIPKSQIYRMQAEKDEKERAAIDYEKIIREVVPEQQFDLIMLGMGEDGHTASLFPHTKALSIKDKLVAINYVEEKKSYRMTFTYPLLQKAKNKIIYVLGKEKQEMVKKVLSDSKNLYPASLIGTKDHPALWILDSEAGLLLSR